MPTETPRHKPRPARPLTLAYVPGVTPGKWIGRWNERQDRELQAYQCPEDAVLDELRAGRADVVFVRVPDEGYIRPADLSVVALYDERPVVAAAKDSAVAAFDELDLADLAGENLLDLQEMGGADVGMEVVASGAGLLILPMAVAKLYSRRDVVSRPVSGVPGTRIAVAWLEDTEDAGVEELVGIVRGRTANSSRQPSVQAEQKTTARQRTKERQSRSGDKASPAAKSGGRSGSKGGGGAKGSAGGKGTAGGKGKGSRKSGKPRR
ncbi:LysR substrate-binding domain-containing protein [Arthrobacter sp. zg-Y1219]|uniref:LysR substrate-binding domain-containing protein n=1 Tax=Arthrobacter sp. zg-Y1219 TaxID=3049067 RepID=UPI0024C43BE6|nr:LysR substrate-binding domain-containing protein [Arthrobacter sp. zg-Y1219]MDK1360602.1 LysR substrate-binding domain-containing protein [Arthrobacter sp. zg-Y1219]